MASGKNHIHVHIYTYTQIYYGTLSDRVSLAYGVIREALCYICVDVCVIITDGLIEKKYTEEYAKA